MKTPEEINDLILKDYLEWIKKDNIIFPVPGLRVEIFDTIKLSYHQLRRLLITLVYN